METPAEKPVEKQPEAPEEQYLTFDDFKKVELRVAEVKSAERVEKADKLLKLQVSLGDEERQIVAGIGSITNPRLWLARRSLL